MRTLWGRATSSNVMKVVWLLEELVLPYERIDAGGPFGRTKEPFYTAMNPTSGVPTLQEGAFTLWESNAILRYLAAVHADGTALWPADLQARANIDRWMDWQQTYMGPHQTVVFQGLIRTPADKRDNAAIAAAIDRAGHAWGILDAQLAGRDFITGPDFTIADIAAGVHVHRWFNFAIARPDLPHLQAWYGRLMQRPPYQQHVAILPLA